MFFQINVTPKEKKAARKITENEQEETKQQEEFTLVLAPFQPQARVKLDTTVHNSVQCRLNVTNPSNRNLHVTVSKTPPKERCIELTAMELLVEAASSADLGIVWTPQECGSWRDTLQLTDSRRIKYDVALMTTASGVIKKAGTKSRLRVLAPSNTNKSVVAKPRRISPPSSREPKKKAHSAALVASNVPSKRPKLNAPPDNNKENIAKPGWTYETSIHKQSNNNPTPRSPPIHDFSAIINSTGFNLTPLNCHVRAAYPEIRITREDSVRFSPQKTGIVSPEMSNPPVLRRETYVAKKLCEVLTMHQVDEANEDEDFADSLSPQPAEETAERLGFHPNQPNIKIETQKSSDFSVLINNMNFLTPKSPENSARTARFSPVDCSTGGRTRPAAGDFPPEDTSSLIFAGDNTFDVSATNVANNTYELSASPTQPKTAIRPTRLSNSFRESSPTIAEKPASSSSLCFERLSARFEYETTTRTSVCYTPRVSIFDDASVKDVLEADLWAKPEPASFSVSLLKGRCSSLEKIVEERDQNSSRFLSNRKKITKPLPTTSEEKSTKTRIDISPPKRNSSLPKTAPIRRVSPTKGSKIRKEKSVLEPSSSLRKKVQLNCSIKRGQVSIPGVRIANLSLAGLRKSVSAKETPSTSRSSSGKEISVKLHDPNDFVTRYCNPDPFGATMTQDPFLTNTLYYDERWMHHQETEFKKWLNALLTPPEHLDADVDTIRVDVGKVWQSCRSREDVALAETREAVSARYHTNTRLNTLRKAACAMFRREEVVAALSKSTVCVERGTLVIRPDRDLHRDIGLQKQILELFLSYNPLWLRIGLETVYGATIPLHSNNDLVGLTRFLIKRFFSDPFIVKNHSHANVASLRLPTFDHHMNKFILKKFLLIVFFLDYAKRNKLIGHDPCLFHKRAAYKESREILLTFSREVLSGVGDVTKVLRSHGYVVSHKQTYLDEYDYAVQHIATDLRDGVRLCRVMELITGDRDLTCRCRVPAISRLQKVHNVELAISALLRCGFTLAGDIDAKSVADGHREKTLSLLWQIIYKYQAPRFDRAAKIVQKWWRANLWYVRTRNFLRRRKDDAASRIQRAWRCFKARRELSELREERARFLTEMEGAVRLIQLRWIERRRMLRERGKFVATREAILRIQRWFRRTKETRPFVVEFCRKRRAAVTIQRRWRARILARSQRKFFLELRSASRAIQDRWRARRIGRECCRSFRATRKAAVLVQAKRRALVAMREARRDFQRKIHAVRIIQSWWRGILALKRDRNDYLLKKHAALTIEDWWKGWRMVEADRSDFQKSRKSAKTIQRAWRRYSQTRSDVARFARCANACRSIQRWWRSARIARRYNQQRRSCVVIQRWWRGAILTREEMANFSRARNAAIVMQKTWRMRKTRSEYLRKRETVVRIQSWYRNARISRAVRRDYAKIRESTVVVQRWWRSLKFARERRAEFLRYRGAVVVVQNRWRANKLAMRTRLNYLAKREAATKIQASWRMTRERRSYSRLLERHRAAAVLQKRWRETLEAREARKTYLARRSACIVIQSQYRALKIARESRSNFLRTKRATIVFQKNWRMLRASRAYREIVKASVILQSRWRSRKRCIETRARFLALKNATVRIQRRYRAKIVGRQTRNKYLQLSSAALNVQRRWRANAKMKEARNRFLECRKAAILVQSTWRMIVERRRYRLTRKSVLTIQSKWRACVEGRKVRTEYETLKTCAVIIQRRFRATRACRIAKEEYARTRAKIIWLQAAWRKKLENRMREEAAIGIQTWWKSIIAMRVCKTRYERQRAATLVIQWRYRAYKIGVETRRDYARVVRSIVRIQRRWRSVIARKRHEEWLRDCKKAALVVENWWLGVLEAKRVREEKLAQLRRETAAATKIQKTWRGHRIRKVACEVIKGVRERARRAAEIAEPTATVGFQMKQQMDVLMGCDNLGQLCMCYACIDTLTQLSPTCCVAFCERNLVDKIYGTLDRSNRSLPWMDVCLKCTNILITLAKLPATKNYIYRVEYIETIARFMTITIDRNVPLFLHLATLFWLLAENPDYANAITSCPRTVWLLNSLQNTANKKSSRQSVANLNKSRCREPMALLPNTKPDWGLTTHKQPRLFTTVHHAVSSLMKRLKIDTIT